MTPVPSVVEHETLAPSTPTRADYDRPHVSKPAPTSRLVRVPVEPVAAHLRQLRQAGMLYEQIAEHGGCSLSTVRDLLGRFHDRANPLSYRHIGAELAERLLAIPVPAEADRSWMADARCRDVDPGFFAPTTGHTNWRKAVVAMCEPCPVRAMCADYRDRTEPYDTPLWWAGTPNRKRQNERRTLEIAA